MGAELSTVRDGELSALRGGAGGAITGWEVLGGGFPASAHLAAVSRFPGERTVFAVGDDGQLHLYGGAGATEHVVLGDGPSLTPGTPIVATSRKPDHWDLFVLSDDGQVWTNWWSADDGFGGWGSIGGSFARQSWVHRNGAWRPIGGRATRAGAPVAAAGRGDWVHLCWGSEGGAVETAWWHPLGNGGWSLDNGVRMRVPTANRLFRAPVETSSELGGQVATRLWRDGTFQVQGHMHDSGWDPYRFTVHTAVHAESGIGLMNHHRGPSTAQVRNPSRGIPSPTAMTTGSMSA